MTKKNQPATVCSENTTSYPVTIGNSSIKITGLRELFCPDATTQITTTTATLGETTAECQTANDELPQGNPCVSSTRRKEMFTVEASDESVKSTRGSSLLPSPANEKEVPTLRYICRKSGIYHQV